MKIGNLELKNNVFMAPMAGITDITFRIVCKQMGAGLVFTEMITARGIHHKNKKTEKMLEVLEEEKPLGIQLFGCEPDIIAEAIEKINDNPDIALIDINMGCPTKKVVKRHEGVALMKDPVLASQIMRLAKKISKKPVTAKFRKGWDSNSINAVEFAQMLEENGADAITIHGRTGEQKYRGKADWDIIRQVKESVRSIPVIGNGDINTPYDAVRMIQQTNCDGVMVARGALGNPWIFKGILQALKGEDVTPPPYDEIAEICNQHLKRELDRYGEKKGMNRFHRHILYYGIKCSFLRDNFGEKNKSRLKEFADKLSPSHNVEMTRCLKTR
ncbi:MAG: tRNA dihydrouridine synthase DusB [Elusimicrobia bacterium RIFOXYB2_FULL_48_7]|nr:MAG: tRNA dihydrouridine synthase DusB [Elusimicrobia bacterium RIFOXYB2_FULL_48_7]